MINIRKGDIVSRKSYNKDIIFIVDRIIKTTDNKTYVILKGLMVRIEADAPIEDLETVNNKTIYDKARFEEKNFFSKVQYCHRGIDNKAIRKMYTAKILHIDGDSKYSEKSMNYYRKIGLNAVVKTVPEHKQPQVIKALLERHKPDILIITGHDAILKNGQDYNNVYNYRNSKYFISAVQKAREWEPSLDKLVIFARRMSKLFRGYNAGWSKFCFITRKNFNRFCGSN